MEDSREEGREQAILVIVRNMLKANLEIEQICEYVGCDEDYVTKVQKMCTS